MQRRAAMATIFGVGSPLFAASAAIARSEAHELQSRDTAAIQILWTRLLDMLSDPDRPETPESAQTRTGFRFTSIVTPKENRNLGATALYEGEEARAGIGTVKFTLIYSPTRSTFKITWPEPACVEVAVAVGDLEARGWVPTEQRPDWSTATGWNFATIAARRRRSDLEHIPLQVGIVPIARLTFPNQFSRCVTGFVMFKLRS